MHCVFSSAWFVHYNTIPDCFRNFWWPNGPYVCCQMYNHAKQDCFEKTTTTRVFTAYIHRLFSNGHIRFANCGNLGAIFDVVNKQIEALSGNKRSTKERRRHEQLWRLAFGRANRTSRVENMRSGVGHKSDPQSLHLYRVITFLSYTPVKTKKTKKGEKFDNYALSFIRVLKVNWKDMFNYTFQGNVMCNGYVFPVLTH